MLWGDGFWTFYRITVNRLYDLGMKEGSAIHKLGWDEVLNSQLQGICRFHHLRSIISFQVLENSEKILHVRGKIKNQH